MHVTQRRHDIGIAIRIGITTHWMTLGLGLGIGVGIRIAIWIRITIRLGIRIAIGVGIGITIRLGIRIDGHRLGEKLFVPQLHPLCRHLGEL